MSLLYRNGIAVLHYCLQTAYPLNTFRSGLGTAILPQRQISMPTSITVLKSPRRRQWKTDLLCRRTEILKAVGKRFEIIRFSEKWSKKKPVNELVYRLCGGELGIRTLGSLWEHSISSAAPSTSRTTLRVYISIRFFFAQISLGKFLERKAGENTEKYSIFNFENPYKWGFPGGRNNQVAVKFRVRAVITTSIPLHTIFN